MVEEGLNEPVVLEWGDIMKGFEEADVVVEDKVEVKPQVIPPSSPMSVLQAGRMMNLPFGLPPSLRTRFAWPLLMPWGCPEGKVRVIYGAIGGGFGSKYVERYQPIAALLSKKAGGKSTKIVLTEELCHAARAGAKIRVKMSAKKWKDDSDLSQSLFQSWRLWKYHRWLRAFWRRPQALPTSTKTLDLKGGMYTQTILPVSPVAPSHCRH